jgi:hypothetical protein
MSKKANYILIMIIYTTVFHKIFPKVKSLRLFPGDFTELYANKVTHRETFGGSCLLCGQEKQEPHLSVIVNLWRHALAGKCTTDFTSCRSGRGSP